MAVDIYVGDPSLKEPPLITMIPSGIDQASLATGTINANSQVNILWTTFPDKPQLSLYNAHFTVRLGANLSGREWPYGIALPSSAFNYEISSHTDIIQTDYLLNRICTVIVMKNLTGSPVDYWCFFKTLTFATSMGVST